MPQHPIFSHLAQECTWNTPLNTPLTTSTTEVCTEMGGNAFRSGPEPLNVVRLQPEQYIKLRDQYQRCAISHLAIDLGLADFVLSILLKFYDRVVVPPEAPEKSDHGDIDFLADEPLLNFIAQDLELELGASAYTKAGGTTSFAIRVSEHSNTFFQLDVHLCMKGCFEWESVIYAYGDLWHIIGSVVTRFGLVINNFGLHARVWEIEKTNKKDALLLLTSEPSEMMAFLGLDDLRYKRGFSTLDELFDWASSMPLFRKKFFEKETFSGKEGRIREKRPMYSIFITEWLPQKATFYASTAPQDRVEQIRSQGKTHKSAGSSTLPSARCLGDEPAEEGNAKTSPLDDRNDVLKKALLRFNKREEYQKMLEDQRKRTLKEAMWRKIANVLPLQGKELGRVMVALKANLQWKDDRPRLRAEAEKSLERVPALNGDTVDEILLPWITEHWKEAAWLN